MTSDYHKIISNTTYIIHMVCLSIYTTMMQGVLNSTDVVSAMWSYIAYSGVLLFAVGKTDRISKSIFGAH